MVVFHITLELFGDKFIPSLFLKELEGDFKVVDIICPHDIKNGKNETYGFGSISIEHPNKYGFSEMLVKYEEWFVEFIEKNIPRFRSHEVEDIWLNTDVFYVDQCSIEVLDKSLLKRISNFEISIPMNIYKLEKEDMYLMLKEEGFDDISMKELYFSS